MVRDNASTRTRGGGCCGEETRSPSPTPEPVGMISKEQAVQVALEGLTPKGSATCAFGD